MAAVAVLPSPRRPPGHRKAKLRLVDCSADGPRSLLGLAINARPAHADAAGCGAVIQLEADFRRRSVKIIWSMPTLHRQGCRAATSGSLDEEDTHGLLDACGPVRLAAESGSAGRDIRVCVTLSPRWPRCSSDSSWTDLSDQAAVIRSQSWPGCCADGLEDYDAGSSHRPRRRLRHQPRCGPTTQDPETTTPVGAYGDDHTGGLGRPGVVGTVAGDPING